MNLHDTAEINPSSMVKQHIMDWKAWRLKNGSITGCIDERIIAGCYLDWAEGSIEDAIQAVETHCCGKYVDRPPFFKCQETLSHLRNLKTIVQRTQSKAVRTS